MSKVMIIPIPDWADEREIWIIAGHEGLAFRRAFSNEVNIKTVRCNSCGKCCRNLPQLFPHPKDSNGDCTWLRTNPDGKCDCIAPLKPITCCGPDPISGRWSGGEEICCIRYEQSSVKEID